jgi:AcrR family transcriptional regulator
VADRSAGSKRQTIKTEALRLFAARGVDAVSVQDIATACAMAKPNLYAHFKSKDELVHALFEEGYREYGRQMTEAVDAGGPFRRKLERLVHLICRLHDEDSARFRFVIMTQHANLPHARLAGANPVEIVIQLVRAGMEAGEIPARHPELIAAAIIGLVVQPATFLQYGRLSPPLAACADAIAGACMRVAT